MDKGKLTKNMRDAAYILAEFNALREEIKSSALHISVVGSLAEVSRIIWPVWGTYPWRKYFGKSHEKQKRTYYSLPSAESIHHSSTRSNDWVYNNSTLIVDIQVKPSL